MSQELNKRSGDLMINQSEKAGLSKEQQTFNKLIQKIAQLRQELKDTTATLDKQLQHFLKQIYPLMQQVVGLRSAVVVLMNEFMTISKGLSGHEKEALRLLIINQLHEIFRYQQEDPEGELLEIFNVLSDITYQDLTEQYLAKLRAAAAAKEKEEETADTTLPMKTTELEAAGSNKRKTKQQLQKEEKERLLEELRRKNVHHLYRQLAKVFHPDLEQDPERIQQKEELMKQLTIAREKGDLLSMLELELNWIQQEDRHPDQLTNEKLRLYNTTLQEQVKDLQQQISNLFHHPRYAFLQGFAKNVQGVRFIDWKTEKNNLDNLAQGLKEIIAGLSMDTKNALKVLKGVLKWNS
ncbi:J domain-containing protein [Chitinophaga pinensis]|uniref:J domain-containing protein n=1 Tax=Chitinophaga pinensis (strain ATCC 43595 / DSM 2588 / LMG 13176 / NBRC 15968 / NCIMB 11800 / UQM 2034) TaxID=485918 RepID=A0A979GB17_CHIPD|nr:hypothetical protein [Chitinophaga pinensis]ACU64058.1 hypothetical protein Cpin_6654 [Chitinophaga pinensis DSM 2588]